MTIIDGTSAKNCRILAKKKKLTRRKSIGPIFACSMFDSIHVCSIDPLLMMCRIQTQGAFPLSCLGCMFRILMKLSWSWTYPCLPSRLVTSNRKTIQEDGGTSAPCTALIHLWSRPVVSRRGSGWVAWGNFQTRASWCQWSKPQRSSSARLGL